MHASASRAHHEIQARSFAHSQGIGAIPGQNVDNKGESDVIRIMNIEIGGLAMPTKVTKHKLTRLTQQILDANQSILWLVFVLHLHNCSFI